MIDGKYILAIIVALVAFGCTSVQKNTTAPSLEKERGYDDTVYCFNGRSIVHREGLAGCIDDAGNEIIPPSWDSLEFLTDDIIMLYRSGLAVLATRDGRIFSGNAAPEDLEGNYEDLYSKMEVADILYWDNVLDRLDILCNKCLLLPAADRVQDPSVLSESDELRRILQTPRGVMSDAQLSRLSEIENKFLSLRK